MGAGLWSSPVHRGWRGAQAVVDEPHMALVQLQCQGVIVSLVEKDAVVLVRGHLEGVMRVRPPLSPHLSRPRLTEPSSRWPLLNEPWISIHVLIFSFI